jgi:hypothetical protein
MQGEAAVEADQQVFTARVDRAYGATLEPLGPAVYRVPRLRRLDLDDRPADQRGADAPSGGVDCVALGHPSSVGSCRAFGRAAGT